MVSKASKYTGRTGRSLSSPTCACRAWEVPKSSQALRKINPHVRIVAVSGTSAFYNVDLFQLAKEVEVDVILRKLDPTDRVLVEINRVLRTG